MNNTTKKMIALLLATCLWGGLAALAQEETERSISVEALGVQNIVCDNSDSRFKGNHGFEYRVGVGYTQGTHDYMSPSATKEQVLLSHSKSTTWQKRTETRIGSRL